LALVTNKYEKSLLERMYKKKIFILPHGVDEIYIRTPNLAQFFREKYKLSPNFRIVAYIGRIHKTKGLDIFIKKSFKKIVEEIPEVKLILAGKVDKRYLKKCLNIANRLNILDKIEYLGFISEEDKIALIDAADVIVSPTRHAGESYPLIMDEVRARGKKLFILPVNPAIASYEFVVPVRNLEELTVKIIEVLKSNKSNKIENKSQNYPFLWNEIALELIKIYKSL